MAHFAELDANNKVISVIVVDNSLLLDENGNESEQLVLDLFQQNVGGKWVQTSYNNKFRGRYAAIGGYYDEEKDLFIPPKPEMFPSWIINYETCLWEPPIPCPEKYTIENWPKEYGEYTEYHGHFWDEQTTSWVFSKREIVP